MDTQFLIAFLNIIIIDLVLSGDNAVVVGMASRRLPPMQRKKAILWGTLGAVILRITLTGIATWLLSIPYIKVVGGGMLIWISLKLLIQQEEVANIRSGKDIFEAIRIIVIADFVMSLDNVLAIGGAAKGNLFLVIFGLLLSVPLLMWGSTFVARWMNEYPVLTYFGSGVLTFTATTMMLEDPIVNQYFYLFHLPYIDIIIPVILTIGVLMMGRVWRTRIFTIYHVK
ncbi:MAG TPA: TerC family protein [Bacillota bacterium]|nr:TerC family protein [Bacillota bacterium]